MQLYPVNSRRGAAKMYTLVVTDYRTIGNTLEYIGRFLESCSDYVDIVIVDNSDANDGKAYLDENTIAYKSSLFKGLEVYQFKMFGQELCLIDAAGNGGYSKGNNLGAALSDSLFDNPYYIFSNNDIEFLGTFSFARITNIFKKHENIGIVGPKVIAPDGGCQNPRKSKGFISQMILQPYNIMCLGCRLNRWLWNLGDDKRGRCGWVSGSFMIVRRDSFEQINGFDEGVFLYAEEMIISERLRIHGMHTVYEPGLTVVHHHQGAKSNYRLRKQNHISMRYYYGKYCGIREPWLRLSDFCFESAESIYSIKHKVEDRFRVYIDKFESNKIVSHVEPTSQIRKESGGVMHVAKWEKSKEHTWSGTPWNILLALKKKCSVNEREIMLSIPERIALKVWAKLSALLRINDCGFMEHIFMSVRYRNSTLNSLSQAKLVYTEFYGVDVSDIYLYIDCSVDFVKRSMEGGASYVKYLPMQKEGRSWISKRNKKAIDFYDRCQGIFTMSEWLKNDLIENTGIDMNRVHSVGGGCNIDIAKIANQEKSGNKFLFIGKEWNRKNGPLVLEAFKALKCSHADAELHIAGVPKPIEVKDMNGVFWYGILDYDKISDLYNMCDFLVMPSLFEAYGLVFAEALIFGLPCIGANRFAMPEFIQHGENGYLIDSDDSDNLKRYMELAIENRDELCNFVNENRDKYIRKYSWDAVVDRMLNVMRKDGYPHVC